ncbi:MAG: hypothetical protein K0R09_2877, partial [Clostridiales bacterium]|nr:hypothetical protein [Clostridiales bacterium]
MKRQFKQAALVGLDIIFINVSIFVAYFIKFQWLIPPAYL